MFDRILIPVPPDEINLDVASTGITLADHVDADVLLLSVLDRPQQRDQIRAEPETEARESLAPVIELADDRGISVDQLILDGEAEEAIIDTVDAEEIGLVVMGTHGRSGVGRVILGSVAESVVRTSPVPVLTVTPEATEAVEMPDDA